MKIHNYTANHPRVYCLFSAAQGGHIGGTLVSEDSANHKRTVLTDNGETVTIPMGNVQVIGKSDRQDLTITFTEQELRVVIRALQVTHQDTAETARNKVLTAQTRLWFENEAKALSDIAHTLETVCP